MSANEIWLGTLPGVSGKIAFANGDDSSQRINVIDDMKIPKDGEQQVVQAIEKIGTYLINSLIGGTAGKVIGGIFSGFLHLFKPNHNTTRIILVKSTKIISMGMAGTTIS